MGKHSQVAELADATTSVKMGQRMGVQVYDIQVRILSWLQILGVINLRLRGSKLSIGYGVMEHRETEYERGYGNLPQRGLSRKRQKWDSGLWFESILVN